MSTPLRNPVQPIFLLYSGLHHTHPLDPQSGLGGKLLCAGALDQDGRNLLYAANIAGAASLAASADRAALRLALRDGVVDFLVNSLEEALRILKNEIRKRQAVAVGVAIDPARMVEEMLDRGVLPDLLPPESSASRELHPTQMEQFTRQGARRVLAPEASTGPFLTWTVELQAARWLPQLDALALSVLPQHDHLRSRWVRLAPRYLGRLAQRQHGVAFTASEAAHFRSLVQEWIENERRSGNLDLEVTLLDLC